MRILPVGFQESVAAQQVAASRLAIAHGEIERLEAVVTAGAADGGMDPTRLVDAASDLLAWREIAARLPAPPAVQFDLGAIKDSILRELREPIELPMYAAEVIHYASEHMGRFGIALPQPVRSSVVGAARGQDRAAAIEHERPPVPTGYDLAAVAAVEHVSAAGVALHAAMEQVDQLAGAFTVEDGVQAVRQLVADVAEYVTARSDTGALVVRADREREVRGWRHRCRHHGGSVLAALPAINCLPPRRADGHLQPLRPWTLRQVAGAESYDLLAAVPA